MPITRTKNELKREHYMLSAFPEPPFQLYRWTYDSEAGIDIIERYKPETSRWITHDNEYIRDNFFGYRTDLSPIPPPKNDAEIKEISNIGWKSEAARRFGDA